MNCLLFYPPKYCSDNLDYIAYLYVSPNSRRKGIAEQLIKYAYDHSEHGLALTVNEKNVNAINLYKKLGFIIDKKFDDNISMKWYK